jgi:hypothetical protein
MENKYTLLEATVMLLVVLHNSRWVSRYPTEEIHVIN